MIEIHQPHHAVSPEMLHQHADAFIYRYGGALREMPSATSAGQGRECRRE